MVLCDVPVMSAEFNKVEIYLWTLRYLECVEIVYKYFIVYIYNVLVRHISVEIRQSHLEQKVELNKALLLVGQFPK